MCQYTVAILNPVNDKSLAFKGNRIYLYCYSSRNHFYLMNKCFDPPALRLHNYYCTIHSVLHFFENIKLQHIVTYKSLANFYIVVNLFA